MKKNFTSLTHDSVLSLPESAEINNTEYAEDEEEIMMPKHSTLAAIRQFARVYCGVRSSLISNAPGFVLN